MTNLTKWAVALPFTVLAIFILPALATGRLWWFRRGWPDTIYVILSAGMWLIATFFVDVEQPRGSPDLANLLIPLGLLLSVPVAAYDRVHWLASTAPRSITWLGLALSAAAVALGVSARIYLGRSYSPRAGHVVDDDLVRDGPYRWIRHPMYTAAILWSIGWPLIIGSFLGVFVALACTLPALRQRILGEEATLLAIYGEAYEDYRRKSWRLIPYLY